MPLFVAGDLLKWHHPSVSIDLDLLWYERSRPDKTHVASEDVAQLRQFIQRGGAKKSAYSVYPPIPFPSLQRSESLICVGHHRSELPTCESPAALAHAHLRVEHRAPVVQPDGQGDENPERRREKQAHGREE